MSSDRGPTLWGQLVPSFIKPQLRVEVHIEKHEETKFYTSGSTISGCVTVIPQNELAIESVKISFTGTATTTMVPLQEDIIQSKHVFLSLAMPDSGQALPKLSSLQGGQACRIPFLFVVPHQLPTAACKYTANTIVHQRHLQLPPTIGSWEYNDQAPHAVHIEYAVQAKVITKTKNQQRLKTTEACRALKILPSSLQTIPLDLAPEEGRCRSSTQCTLVREGVLSPYIGNMTAVLRKPNSLTLSLQDFELPEAFITIDLGFSPTTEPTRLPEIRVKSARIQAVTHYSRSHMNYLAGREKPPEATETAAMPYSVYTDIPLKSRDSVVWQLGTVGEKTTRLTAKNDIRPTTLDSGGSSNNYTGTLAFAVSVPKSNKKLFLPSFDSCLVSRTYCIQIVLIVGTSGTTMTLYAPLEVVVDSTEGAGSHRPPLYAEQGGTSDSQQSAPPAYGIS
ncbi:hypothetical protein CEP51_006293 [Fusarium floridanum]|uniref:Arrestin-like N-terminal domain-containing protein n=1 Tax=Fusarium floridanum TaxID=1325733 RepID=A0A428RTT0_9HYPO|nr:hypothetical protein CEP51_006293 [Fusarium floridanum]